MGCLLWQQARFTWLSRNSTFDRNHLDPLGETGSPG
jgi:hypothetical protein